MKTNNLIICMALSFLAVITPKTPNAQEIKQDKTISNSSIEVIEDKGAFNRKKLNIKQDNIPITKKAAAAKKKSTQKKKANAQEKKSEDEKPLSETVKKSRTASYKFPEWRKKVDPKLYEYSSGNLKLPRIPKQKAN